MPSSGSSKRSSKGFARAGAGKKRSWKKPSMSSSMMVPKAPKVHHFKETVIHSQALVCAAGAAGFGTLYFQIGNLFNWPNLKQLFDLYRINQVDIKVIPYSNVSGALDPVNAGGTQGNLATLMIAPNRSTTVPDPTQFNDVLNDDGAKIVRLDTPCSFSIKYPKPETSVYAPPGGGGAVIGDLEMQFKPSADFQPWLSTGGNGATVDQSLLAHHGFRWAISNPGAVPINYTVYATYHFSCKEQD